MVVVCQIVIDKPSDGVHRAGGTVSGVVKYAMDQPTEFKDIRLSLKGESWCSWSRLTRACVTTMHLGLDKHLTLETKLLDSVDETRILPAGSYEYKFKFTLPKDIPPSIYTPTGNILYKLSLEIKRQSMFNLITRFVEAEVLVQNYVHPLIPSTPLSYSVTKGLLRPLTIGKLRMGLKAEIASPYIRPGEKAELKLEITNEPLVKIKGIRAELISTTMYTASCGRTKTEMEKISDCVTEIAKVPTLRTIDVDVSVPVMEEQSVRYSRMISREYKIVVTVRLRMPYRNIYTTVPIFV